MNSPRHADDSEDDLEDDYRFMDGRDDSDAVFSDSDNDIDNDPYCNGCERQFVDMVALNQHLFDSAKHNWCFDCSRDFTSESALSQVSSRCHAAPTISDSGPFRSIKTPSPIADATSNALSARACTRVPLESLCTSNLDATTLPDTKSLLRFAP